MSEATAASERKCYEINCGVLIKDSLLNLEDFKSYLEARIKIKGKVGFTADNVEFECTPESLLVSPKVKLSKKYLKYLGNKFLYKKELKDWVRIISTGKKSYKLAYYRVDSNKDE